MNRGCSQRVFLHDYLASGARADTVADLGLGPEHQFSERALLLSQPEDLVIVPTPLEPIYLNYLRSLSTEPMFGTTVVPTYCSADKLRNLTVAATRDDALLAAIAGQLDSGSNVRLSCYYRSVGGEEFASALRAVSGCDIEVEGGSAAATAHCNRKELLHSVASCNGIGLAPGGVIKRNPNEQTCDFSLRVKHSVTKVLSNAERCIVRGCKSQSGLDAIVVASDALKGSLEEWLFARPAQTHYLVEEFVDAEDSPNVQAWINHNGQPEDLALVTNQRLIDQLSHFGNSYPVESSVLQGINELTQTLSAWIAQNGYTGSVGYDLIRVNGVSRPLLAEVNSQTNAATYFLSLFEKLNAARSQMGHPALRAWVSHKKMTIRQRSLEELFDTAGDLLYQPNQAWGCLPVGSGLVPFGYVMLVTYADSIEDATALEMEFQKRVS